MFGEIKERRRIQDNKFSPRKLEENPKLKTIKSTRAVREWIVKALGIVHMWYIRISVVGTILGWYDSMII